MRILPSGRNGIFLRVIAILWILACVSLLIHALLLRNASPHTFGDAEEMEGLLMLVLAFPSSLIAFLPFRGIKLGYPENDLRSILLGWFIFFVIGYLQWFVLVPRAIRWTRRKFGNHDVGDSAAVEKGN